MPPARATLRFDGPHAAALEAALSPEAAEPILRGRLALRREGDAVVVEVEAEDVVALRAGVNTMLRAAAVAVDAARAVD